MLRNLTKGARLVKAPARFFGAHAAAAHGHGHHAAETLKISADNAKLLEKLSAAPWGGKVPANATLGGNGTEYKFPEFQVDYSHLHFVNPQAQYVPADCEGFIYAPLQPSAESTTALYESIVKNAPASYEETLKQFPDTVEGKKDKADFIELFEPVVFQERFVDATKPAIRTKYDIDSKDYKTPNVEMGFMETMLYSFSSGTAQNRMNYGIGMAICAVSAGYVCYRGIAEINGLFEMFAHGHDDHH